MFIDLRSDTVTRPSQAMREAIYAADVGDDVFGDDPTVHLLEQKAADLFGMEAALYLTSGTMGNLVALLTHCQRGDAAILGANSHILNYEGGGLSALGGILPLAADDSRGCVTPQSVAGHCRPSNVHFAPATLLCLENTHNACGGLALSPEDMGPTVRIARQYGLKIHLDGARLFNAAVAWGSPVNAYSSLVDSVQICLSKGLGAPMGSLLCGTKEFVTRARMWRKKVGGGLRQSGIVAAAGVYALDHNIPRLHDDHENARRLAAMLTEGGIDVEHNAKPTNMVYFKVPEGTAEILCGRCTARKLLIGAAGAERIRLVTHLDVSPEQVQEAATILLEEVKSL